MVAMDAKRVVDARGAAKYLMVAPITVVRLARQGLLGRKVGKVWRFKIDELDRYVSNPKVMEEASRGANNEQVSAGNS